MTNPPWESCNENEAEYKSCKYVHDSSKPAHEKTLAFITYEGTIWRMRLYHPTKGKALDSNHEGP
jgi:hypothetical protein